MRLLVAIPCLNEAATVGDVISAVPRKIRGIDQVVVLVVDDGSTDNTVAAAITAQARVVSHGYNRGVGAAFQTALATAISEGFDVMVNVDADGQFDPADIPTLVEPVALGDADFVTASRFADPALVPVMPIVKKWGNHGMALLVGCLSGRRFKDVSCGFRAYSREAMLNLNLTGRFTYTQESFIDLSFKQLRILEVPVRVRYFPGRRSRVAGSIPRYAVKTLSIILRAYRDFRPLVFFWSIAAVFILAGLGISSILVYHRVTTGIFSGQIWSGFLGGALLLTGLVFGLVGMTTDMLDRIRVNQERILYHLKRISSDAVQRRRGDG
ncbi:MAG: glycosyltransferase family 2 protein [Deltaproteobacteria bacterium]|nr:glycosyltransferase family 2 protein [Deltaproteobacteria bacterium]